MISPTSAKVGIARFLRATQGMRPRLTNVSRRSMILAERYYHGEGHSMKSVSLKLPDDLHAKLTQLSQLRGAAKSDVIRDALEAYLVDSKNGTRVSCLDLAGDLVGCVEGPPDLATNPKYMRGFGK
jgi:Ribbon-helix-helix protein, copG family